MAAHEGKHTTAEIVIVGALAAFLLWVLLAHRKAGGATSLGDALPELFGNGNNDTDNPAQESLPDIAAAKGAMLSYTGSPINLGNTGFGAACNTCGPGSSAQGAQFGTPGELDAWLSNNLSAGQFAALQKSVTDWE
jgi:hypothetical protein